MWRPILGDSLMLRTAVFMCLLTWAAAHVALAQESLDPSTYSLRGTVVDQAGTAIEGASLVLASPTYQADMLPQMGYGRSVNLVEAKTDQAGEFRIGFARDDNRFLQPGNFRLIVSHPDYSAELRSESIFRFSVDLPLEVTLQPKSDVQLHVFNAAGNPASNVNVAIARSQNIELPFQVAKKFDRQTNSSGTVDLPIARPDQLQAVYVYSAETGHQRLTVQPARSKTNPSQFNVQMLKSNAADATLQLPPDAESVDFEGISVVAISLPPNSNAREATDYSWGTAQSTKAGKLMLPILGHGQASFLIEFPPNFPFRPHPWEASVLNVTNDNSKNTTNIALKHVVPVVGTVVNKTTKDPIKNIYIWGGLQVQPIFTDDEGKFEFKLAIGGTVDLFPFDATYQQVLPTSFYRRTTALKDLKRVVVEQCELLSSKSMTGTVIDSSGQPVAGAIVNCERSSSSSTYSVKFLSDRNGQFQIQGCRPDETVNLTAKFKSQSTKQPTSCSIDSENAPTLIVEPQLQVAFSGTILDQNKNPIDGAIVDIVKEKLIQPEGYSSKRVQLAPLSEESVVMSNNQGVFQTKFETEVGSALWVKIKSPGHRDFISPPIDIQKLDLKTITSPDGSQRATANLGDLRLTPKPIAVATAFKVVSTSGEPVEAARVVIVGARTNKASGLTGQDGAIRLEPEEERQVLAISKSGFKTHFQIVDSPSELKLVVLTPTSDVAQPIAPRPRAAQDYSIKTMRQMAADLLEKVEAPIPEKASSHRMFLYSRCLVTAEPARFVELMENPDIQEKETLIAFMAEDIALANSELIPQLAASLADPAMRSAFWVTILKNIADPDRKAQFLSESVIAAREASSIRQVHLFTSIAKSLMKDGQLAEARELILDIKNSNQEIQNIANSEKPPRNVIGLARNFAPILAMEDVDLAFKLIGKNPEGQEQPGQQTQALLYLAESNPKLFEERLTEFGYENLDGYGVESFLNDFGAPSNPDVCIKLLNQLPDSVKKAKAQTSLGKALLEKGNPRGQDVLIDASQSFTRVKKTQLNSDFINHPSSFSVLLLEESFGLPASTRDAVAFDSLWMWSGSNLEGRDFGLPAYVSQGLAEFDSDLARAIIEPCFEDMSWLHNGLHSGYIMGIEFSNCFLLKAATKIDPAWGIELCTRLIEGPYADDSLRQLELVHAVCASLGEMIVERSGQTIQPR